MCKTASHPNTVALIPIVRQAALSSYAISKLNTIIVSDIKIEILDTKGPFTAKSITETNSASLFVVHHGKERSVK